MKRYLLILVFASLAILNLSAATQSQLTGRVVDEQSAPIGYATIVVSRAGAQVAGAATDDEGRFALALADGGYLLTVSFVGYDDYSAEITEVGDLGDITLKQSATAIDGVEVKANFIRREADRFVVDVANAPSAIGQDGEELLRSAPGVWVDDEKISINGSSNPTIFVNDRELKMSAEQILIYIRNLKSEEVRRIEVIPLSGVDQDANSASGAIKIYLKRQLESGVVGSVTTRGSYSEYMNSLSPSASVNFQADKLTINSNGWYNRYNSTTLVLGNSEYKSGALLRDENTTDSEAERAGGRVEAIYDFNDRHSVGAELSLYDSSDNDGSVFTSDMRYAGGAIVSNGKYGSVSDSRNISATFNYIYKLDTLGSTLKLLADHNRNLSDSFSDSQSATNGLDSLYRAMSDAKFKVSTVSLAYEQKLGAATMLKAGVKYTNNDMDSYSQYSHFKDDKWQESAGFNSDEDYTENISAAYASASSRLGRWGFVAGLRAEQTSITSGDGLLDKDYLSLFPNANVSYSFDDMSSNSVVLQYSRSISRPSFWSMDPKRSQISEYSYQIGNPALKPAYSNSVNLSFVYKCKYSLTLGSIVTQNATQQVVLQDEDAPNVSYFMPVNMENQDSYYASLNLPFQFTKWWSFNANATYMYRGEKISSTSGKSYHNMLFANAQTTFTLPLDFYITASCYCMNDMYSGNIFVEGRSVASLALKKQFAKKRFTATLSANSLFGKNQKIISTTESMTQCMISRHGWGLPSVGLSLSYNFKAGKEYQQRAGVESASGSDASRISSGSANE